LPIPTIVGENKKGGVFELIHLTSLHRAGNYYFFQYHPVIQLTRFPVFLSALQAMKNS